MMIENRIRIDADLPGFAFAGDTEIALTKNEFRILGVLLEGKVATRAMILKAIGNAEDMNTRTIDMHISRLKRKVAKFATIESVRGFGYRIRG